MYISVWPGNWYIYLVSLDKVMQKRLQWFGQAEREREIQFTQFHTMHSIQDSMTVPEKSSFIRFTTKATEQQHLLQEQLVEEAEVVVPG